MTTNLVDVSVSTAPAAHIGANDLLVFVSRSVSRFAFGYIFLIFLLYILLY